MIKVISGAIMSIVCAMYIGVLIGIVSLFSKMIGG
jgi:hypothetical protein